MVIYDFNYVLAIIEKEKIALIDITGLIKTREGEPYTDDDIIGTINDDTSFVFVRGYSVKDESVDGGLRYYFVVVQMNLFDSNYYLLHYEMLPKELNKFNRLSFKIIGTDRPNSVEVEGIFVAVGFPEASDNQGTVKIYNLKSNLDQVYETPRTSS